MKVRRRIHIRIDETMRYVELELDTTLLSTPGLAHELRDGLRVKPLDHDLGAAEPQHSGLATATAPAALGKSLGKSREGEETTGPNHRVSEEYRELDVQRKR